MSIKIIHDRGRSRPVFYCDECRRDIKSIEDGIFVWPSSDEYGEGPSVLLCSSCNDRIGRRQPMSQELATGLIYLLYQAGWLDEHCEPTEKFYQAISNVKALAEF